MKRLVTYFSKLFSPLLGLQSSDVSHDCRLTVGSPSGFDRSSLLRLTSVLVLVFTLGIGNMWAVDPPTLSGLSFPTPAIDENFDDIAETSSTAKFAIATSQSSYGDINHLYNNNSSNANTIAISGAGNNISSRYFSLSQGSTNQLIGQISGGSFSQKGAWRATIEKTSHGFIGLYNSTTDVTGVNRNCASAFIQNNNGTITIQTGTGSSQWTAVGSSSSNTIDICVVYNLTASDATYCGGTISLPSMKAHVYIDGTCVNTNGTPTNFGLQQSATICAFRVHTNGNGWHMYVDDIKVYNSLPGAAASCGSDPTVTAASNNGSFWWTPSLLKPKYYLSTTYKLFFTYLFSLCQRSFLLCFQYQQAVLSFCTLPRAHFILFNFFHLILLTISPAST